MRAVGAILFGVLASLCLGQVKELEDQKQSLSKLPPISYKELIQCVKAGDNPSTATLKFMSPGTGKKSANPFSGATSYTWPTPGQYQEKEYQIFGDKWKHEEKVSVGRMFSMFDGTSYIDGSEYNKKRSIYYRDRAFEEPLVRMYFSLPEGITRSMKVTGKSVHPEFGNLVHLSGSSEEVDLAVDRDLMVVHRKYGNTEEQVLKMEQVEGRWIPSLGKQTRSDGLDVYTTIKDIKILPANERVFTIAPKPGDFVMKGNVYYDVDKRGGLVKSKVQPDRTTEYLSWVGMGALTIFILSVVIIGVYKLTRKPEGLPH